MHHRPSRREFLKVSAVSAAGLALGVPSWARQSPNDRLRFACIGVGGKGSSDVESAAAFGEIVALVDIDANVLAGSMAKYPGAKGYSDFRKLFDEMADKFDAVTVSTPDHTHAVASAMAMRNKKHVFCQKPLTRTLWEARRLGELARENKVASQMGNQFTAHNNLRRTAALIRNGTYGKVKEVHCWTDRAGGWWPQGVERPTSKDVPAHVDWDAFLGPSPFRAYADGYHPFAWRGWWDFGSGALGDIGCHCINMPFMALDLLAPVAVSAETSGHNRDSYPVWSIVTYEFPQTKLHPAFKLYWYDGGKRPSADLVPGLEVGGNGCIVVLEKATLLATGEYAGETKVVGGEPLAEAEYEQSPGHFEEFVNAIRGGKPAVSNIPDYSGPLTETVLLGNLAVWASGKRVEWDARALRTKGTNEFDSLIRPAFRPGWTL